MGPIVATYLVKVTVRAPDVPPDSDEPFVAPTNDAIASAVSDAVARISGLEANATSERTDR